MIYGSEGDWISQHVAVAESLRDAMLTQRTLIPQYINLGGGSSVYDFAYYGLLRPDVLISCLMPSVPMVFIISGYAILCIIASAVLMYLWLIKKGMQKKFAVAGAILLVCSGSFFQFHRQIMFVNYMPYLLLALLGVDRLRQKRRSGLLTLALVLIYLHSFYYAIACLCVVGIYGIHLVLEQRALQAAESACTGQETAGKASGKLWKELWGMIGRLALCVAISIAIAMVLLLPTGLDILSTAKDGGSFSKSVTQIVDFSFRGMLYSAYSCGMTLVALYGLLLSLTVKGKRFLSVALLICVSVPAVNLALNGFLYAREKILIPFVPLLVLVTAETLQRVFVGEQKARLWPALLCFVPCFFEGWKTPEWKDVILLDAGVVTSWALLQFVGRHWPWGQEKRIGRYGKMILLKAGFLLLAAAPIVTSVTLNRDENYMDSDDRRQSRFTDEEIARVAADPNYRFDVITDRIETCNLLYGNTKRSSMYSSISNDEYSTFYYDTIGNAIPANNRVALLPGVNPCANYFLGVRYLLCSENQVPAGYSVKLEKDGYVLAENPAVLPVCYGTYDPPVTEENLKTAVDPKVRAWARQREETATGQAGTDLEDPLEIGLLAEHLKQLCAGMETELPIAIARLSIDSSGKKPVIITLNGVRNKLSAKSAPYPNHNDIFTYVMATAETPEEWTMERSDGDYILKDIQWTAIEPEEWGSREIVLPKTVENTAGAKEKDANVYHGVIQMTEDGWFVTSYPWRKGYEIRVDGTKVQPQKINTAFVGFPLSAGEHEVAIGYTAPGFRAGLMGTILGGVAFVLLLLWEKKKRPEAVFYEIRESSLNCEEGENENDRNNDGKKENQRNRPLL